jgi:hypothetical protein
LSLGSLKESEEEEEEEEEEEDNEGDGDEGGEIEEEEEVESGSEKEEETCLAALEEQRMEGKVWGLEQDPTGAAAPLVQKDGSQRTCTHKRPPCVPRSPE